MDTQWLICFEKAQGRWEGVPPGEFDTLVQTFPDSLVSPDEINIRLKTTDEFKHIVAFAKSLGLSIPRYGFDRVPGVEIYCHPIYTDQERRAAAFVQCCQGNALAYPVSVIDGTLKRDGSFKQALSRQIGPIGNGRFGVRATTRQKIEANDFTGVGFEEAEIQGGWKSEEEKIWILTSHQVLPPMLSLGCNNKGTIFQSGEEPETDEGYYVFDGFVSDSRIAFRSTALVADFSVTSERFGNVKVVSLPRYICSNRFYHLCNSLDGSLVWKMVLLDERAEVDDWRGLISEA